MPPIESADLHQTALCWLATGFDVYGQQTRAANPVTLCVRWVAAAGQPADPLLNTEALDATVVVDRPIPLRSLLQLQGGDDATYHEVVVTRTTPDIGNRAWRRTLGLRRWQDTLPAVTVP